MLISRILIHISIQSWKLIIGIIILEQSDAVKNLIVSLTHYLVDEIKAEFKAEKPNETGAELSITFILEDGSTSAFTNNANESYTLNISISDQQVRNFPAILIVMLEKLENLPS